MKAGELIREQRIARDLTLREVGKACNVSHVFIREIELGKKRPGPTTSDLIADVLSLDARTLRAMFCDEATANTRKRWGVRK